MNVSLQPWKTAALGLFALVCVATFVYLYTGTGARLPGMSAQTYETTFVTKDAGNIVGASDVKVAGVVVGKVQSVENKGNDGAVVSVRLDDDSAPLHEGAEVRVGERSVVGEGYVEIVDGKGTELPSGTTLPEKAVRPSVQLHDVLTTLDPKTRSSLKGLVRSLGNATGGTERDVSALLEGMGDLGAEGYTAVDAISAQSADLKKLVAEASTALRALNTSQGQLGRLTSSADTIFKSTAGQSESIRGTVRQLPSVLRNGRSAVVDLEGLAGDLGPVAVKLKKAAPHVTKALEQLPATTQDLRALLPDLDVLLGRAPRTLKKVPAVAGDVSDVVPTLQTTLTDLNPMLSYLSPYGPDLAAFFTNFGAIMDLSDEAGTHYLRLAPIEVNEQLVDGVPLKLPEVLSWKNPYPAPGQGTDPGPENGRKFTRIQPQP